MSQFYNFEFRSKVSRQLDHVIVAESRNKAVEKLIAALDNEVDLTQYDVRVFDCGATSTVGK